LIAARSCAIRTDPVLGLQRPMTALRLIEWRTLRACKYAATPIAAG
jgi:hypothetical protein